MFMAYILDSASIGSCLLMAFVLAILVAGVVEVLTSRGRNVRL